jgi:hypothetical protein
MDGSATQEAKNNGEDKQSLCVLSKSPDKSYQPITNHFSKAPK